MERIALTDGCYRKIAVIEPDVFDDENGHGYDPLARWGDRRFSTRDPEQKIYRLRHSD